MLSGFFFGFIHNRVQQSSCKTLHRSVWRACALYMTLGCHQSGNLFLENVYPMFWTLAEDLRAVHKIKILDRIQLKFHQSGQPPTAPGAADFILMAFVSFKV